MAEDSKTFAFLATFLGIIGFVIALLTKKDDKYVMHYAKQSLVLFVATVVLYVIATVLTLITFGLALILWPIIYLIVLIFWILSWIYALSGEKKELPLIGQFGDKFNF